MSLSSILQKALFPSFVFIPVLFTYAQQITGTWQGKLGNQKAELKIIQNGDSLTGTAYYAGAGGKYTRFSIKGYFDQSDNSVVWWDERAVGSILPGHVPLTSRADFNCPDGGRMTLDGKKVSLEKTGVTEHPDEWDPVIEEYTAGMNDPYIIDSVEQIAWSVPLQRKPETVRPVTREPVRTAASIDAPPSQPRTIEEKYIAIT